MIEIEQGTEKDALVPVGDFPTMGEANDHALVVLAMNLSCWIHLDAESKRFVIFAEPAFAVAIEEEFRLYALEQEEWRGRMDPPLFNSGLELAMLWVATLVTVFLFQDRYPSLSDQFCNSSTALVDGGEWWRPFTALFLHGDGPHLLGNIAIGGVFCVLVAQSFGPWLGWLLILLSGTIGNVVTALWHSPENFRSLGASTATFGALGLLIGMGVYLSWRSRSYREMKSVIVPIGVGVIMLGWWGAGGGDLSGNTDVLGHVFGFLSGLLLGGVVAALRLREHRQEAGMLRSM